LSPDKYLKSILKMDTLQRRALEKQKKLEEQQLAESLESYQVVLEYLLDEGFASSEDSADKIILNMSESWFQSILEGKEDRARDKRQEKGGVAANVDYNRPPAKKLSNKELGIPEMSDEEREKRKEQMKAHLKKMKM